MYVDHPQCLWSICLAIYGIATQPQNNVWITPNVCGVDVLRSLRLLPNLKIMYVELAKCLYSVNCSAMFEITAIGNSYPLDIKLIPHDTSGKGVNIYATDNLSRGSGTVGPKNLV